MVRTMRPIRSAMTTSARGGLRRPKKAGVQSAFAASCQPHRRNGRAAPHRRHTSQPATPMATYSMDHTGPNNQVGGVPGGAASEGYHPRTACSVNVAPTAPTRRHSPTNPTRASTGDTGVDDPGLDPHSLGLGCWKTRLLSVDVVALWVMWIARCHFNSRDAPDQPPITRTLPPHFITRAYHPLIRGQI